VDPGGYSKAGGGDVYMKDPQKVLFNPRATEKAIKMIESENKLIFSVADDATKRDVKHAVEMLYEVKVLKVNLEKTPRGEKRAYVRLTSDFSAEELAAKLGMV
jgi:large subunit ribosomal protein L23